MYDAKLMIGLTVSYTRQISKFTLMVIPACQVEVGYWFIKPYATKLTVLPYIYVLEQSMLILSESISMHGSRKPFIV